MKKQLTAEASYKRLLRGLFLGLGYQLAATVGLLLINRPAYALACYCGLWFEVGLVHLTAISLRDHFHFMGKLAQLEKDWIKRQLDFGNKVTLEYEVTEVGQVH